MIVSADLRSQSRITFRQVPLNACAQCLSDEALPKQVQQVVTVKFPKLPTLERTKGHLVFPWLIFHAIPCFLSCAFGRQPGILRRNLVKNALLDKGNTPPSLDMQDVPFKRRLTQVVRATQHLDQIIVVGRRVA